PDEAADELGASVEGAVSAGFTDHVQDHRARLAQIYAAKGQTDRAIECARAALTEYATVHDPRSEARLRYVAVSLAAGSGDAGSLSGLECAQMVARSWWAQRLSKLHSVQRVLVNEDLIRRNHRYKREAREDPLTGVGNRRALDEHMSSLMHTGDPVSVVVVDVNDFKSINDSYGHSRGDEALCAIASLVTDHTRDQDLVARTGGDEFAVVLHSADRKETTELVDRLRLALLDFTTVTPHEHLQVVRLSFGWASTSEGISPGSLIDIADARMYEDKDRGAAAAARRQRPRPTPQT
ncbi:MAG: GGDEF domain-containing protein, partial [Nocardioidaceae bacterium]